VRLLAVRSDATEQRSGAGQGCERRRQDGAARPAQAVDPAERRGGRAVCLCEHVLVDDGVVRGNQQAPGRGSVGDRHRRRACQPGIVHARRVGCVPVKVVVGAGRVGGRDRRPGHAGAVLARRIPDPRLRPRRPARRMHDPRRTPRCRLRPAIPALEIEPGLWSSRRRPRKAAAARCRRRLRRHRHRTVPGLSRPYRHRLRPPARPLASRPARSPPPNSPARTTAAAGGLFASGKYPAGHGIARLPGGQEPAGGVSMPG
jgi:hypothetical protein